MRIEPLKRTVSKPIALIVPGYRCVEVITVDGSQTARGPQRCRELLTRYEKHRCYLNGGLTHLRHTTGALQWTANIWRGRATSMTLDGTRLSVCSLRGALEGSTTPLQDLLLGVNWLNSFGVGSASPSTMAWNLWRSTLSDAITIDFNPEISRRALFGGRQEIREPRTYKHMVSVDICAAYPHSMAERPYALALAPVDPATVIDPSVAGLARAKVMVPDSMPYFPLPVRVGKESIQFQSGWIEGTWPWCELAVAKDLGCEVEVLSSWAPVREADLFGAWWKLVQEGRSLPGAAARIAKMIANALWGMFSMRGDDRSLVGWSNDAGTDTYVIETTNRRLPHARATHVAAETTARVRSRVTAEALYQSGRNGAPVHVDTDGIIVRKSNDLPSNSGLEYGQWRVKQAFRKVEIRAPQLYKWWCKSCGAAHPEGHYVAAGASPAQAVEIFRTVSPGRVQVGWRPNLDVVLPQANAQDPRRLVVA